ncbi:phage tail protein [Pseudomonas piscis]|uniref:phage tail protein n=1 Tax=Pseudomonas piscis TaxID=2614538 RepID=UPI0021D5E9F5|nr:tail fiber protein [Pseudomonas piscis]MCU7647182.1 tail fiber protein [Pseudomonas piscis]
MDAFTGEIRLFPFNFAPESWALCDGKLLLVQEYPALYSVIGNTYGGTSGVNFNLPNLNGRVAIGAGQGTGLSQRVLGETVGADKTSLLPANFAPHTHQVLAKEAFDASTALDVPNATALLAQPRGIRLYNGTVPSIGGPILHPSTVTVSGTASASAGSTRNVMQPYLTLRYCICLNGEYPQKP